MARKTKSLAEQLSELDNPAPKDFDPEEEQPDQASDSDISADEQDQSLARDHYVDVPKSKLRKRDVVPLGPRYEGAKISRDVALGADEDDEENDPFSKGFDEEDSEEEDGESIDGEEDDDEESEEEEDGDRKALRGMMTEDSDSDDSEEASDNDDEEDEEESDEDGRQKETIDRATLRKSLAQDQKSVSQTLLAASKADAQKGRAVKLQRKTFDSLLNTRIKLQKALIGVNSISGLPSTSADDDDNDKEEGGKDTDSAIAAAESAAFSLWSTLNNLRTTLLSSTSTGQKRSFETCSLSSSLGDLYTHQQSLDALSSPQTTATLEKWSQKSRSTTSATATVNRLARSSAQQPLSSLLQEQYTSNRLYKRARTPRSCAPVQLAKKILEDESIYDDADFYGLLLQSLLEQRSADSVAASSSSNLDVSFQMRREAKTKKNVDTKASKGRKLRYTVHEKLQNFMAPEDRNGWGERQKDELFGSLFGQRMGLDLDEEDVQQEDGDEEQDRDMEEAGLMLFRS